MTDIISSLPSKADNTTTLNVAIPAGAVAGQVLAVYVGSSAGSGGSVSSLECVAVPGADAVQSTNSRQTLFTRTLDGTEGGSVLFSSTLATDLVATALLFPSGTVVNAVASPVEGYFSVDVSTPVVTTTVADALIIRSLVTRNGEFTAPNTPVDTVVQDATDLVISKQQQAVIGNSSAEVFSVVTGNHAALLTVAFVSPAAGATVDKVGVGANLTDGSVGNELLTSGFSDPITAKLKSGVHEVAVLNIAGSSGAYTFDLVDTTAFTVDTIAVPYTSATHVVELEVTDGTNTASLPVTYHPASGWAFIDIVGASADPGSGLDQIYIDDSQIVYDTANGTSFDQAGLVESDGTLVDFSVWDADTGLLIPASAPITSSSDEIKPVITVFGSLTPTVELGGSWPGVSYQATDNVDGDITLSVIEVGAVDVNTKGNYPITLNVTDAANNAATEVVVTVSVIDTTAPSVPQNVQADSTGQTTAVVTCDPSSDLSGVAGYKVFLDGVEHDTTLSPSYAFINLDAGTQYTATMLAYDEDLNESALGVADTFETDAEPPPAYAAYFSAVSMGPGNAQKFKKNHSLNRYENADQSVILPLP